ncbi:MAG: flagellar motor protein MotB [Deltaproteobacteria bacterium]|nr:flagellar motor protein MotB [Deltaproteobacteria bacterium]
MLNKISFIALCLPFILLSACVQKSKYVELETAHNQTRQQLQMENKTVADLREQVTKLVDENNRHLKTIEDQKGTIEGLEGKLDKERSVVQQKDKKISNLEKTRAEIENSLKEQIAQKNIKIEEIEGKLKVTFVDKILFDSGSVKIKPKGREVILTLADSFKDNKGQSIVVEGHTDDVQIGSALQDRFPTNWELSAARATSVVRFLQEKGAIEPERLTASGFSFYKPVDTNETDEGRKQNRRIEIILIPER